MVDLGKQDEYIASAENDCTAVELLAPHIDRAAEVICYHCHQAAEKMLGQMVFDNGRFPKRTHSLQDMADSAIGEGTLHADRKFMRAILFLDDCGSKARCIALSETGKDDAIEAILSMNAVADTLEANGYRSVRAECNALPADVPAKP